MWASVWCRSLVFRVAVVEEMSRDELIALLARRDVRIVAQGGRITALSTQVADLVEADERLAAQLARLEYLLSRNLGNSLMLPSKDDDLGKAAPPVKP